MARQLVLAAFQICTQTYPEAFLRLSVARRQQLQQALRQLGEKTSLEAIVEEEEWETTASATSEEDEKIVTPDNVAQWCQEQEQALADWLKEVSLKANLTLVQAGILPQQLPAKMLEAAMEADDSGAAAANASNLVSFLLEVEEEEKDEQAVIQVSAIRLRRSEIEFSDPSLNSRRSRIRHLVGELQTLRDRYRKVCREEAIARAEAAWRSIWFED